MSDYMGEYWYPPVPARETDYYSGYKWHRPTLRARPSSIWQSRLNYMQSVRLLEGQLRRTDVELRHLTKDKDIKEFESDVLRIIRIQSQLIIVLKNIGIAPLDLLMVATGGVTSAATMSELA